PGTVALREIRRYQKSTELLIRKLPFQRLKPHYIALRLQRLLSSPYHLADYFTQGYVGENKIAEKKLN
ncbi:hypothetical protein NP493_4193g00028, partial [Ridgeia piscesae]